jgi:hypothetical protein
MPLGDVLELNDVLFVNGLKKNLILIFCMQSINIQLHLKDNNALSMIVV